MSDDVLFDVTNRVATITFNRPGQRNAFDLPMIDECAELLRKASKDSKIGALILTGSEGAFCSGIDLSALQAVEDTPLARKEMLTDRIHKVLRVLDECEKPVIAAINGSAIGAGLDMALACDMRFAARSARMAEGYIRVGLIPGDGGCFFLPRLVGPAKALELILSGDTVGATEALRIGMVNRVIDDNDLLSQTHEFASRLATQAALPMALIKRASRQAANSGDLRAHLDLVSSHLAIVMSTDEFRLNLDKAIHRTHTKGQK